VQIHWGRKRHMALKPTIYKAQVELADSDRNCFESLALTLAQHPSETLERMTVRLLAYCLNCARGLQFTRGISTTDEPDLWLHSDSGEIQQWIEVGQPEEPRLRKACGRAREVIVYTFARSTATWWKLNADAIRALPRLQVWQLDPNEIKAVADMLDRTVQLSVSIVGEIIYVGCGTDSASVEPSLLYRSEEIA
jgi:uncharacterized protein YaeQ